MDGLRLRIDLRPGTEVPVYPEDDVDANPSFNEYPAQEEFVEGPDWVPGQIPPKIRSPEYGGGSSDTSLDMQAACAIEAVLVTTAPAPDEVVASTSAMGDMCRIELTPLLGLSQQFTLQMEREIQKQIQEQSRKLVQEVLHQSANLADATALVGSCPSLPLPVFPDGPSRPLPNIGTIAGVGETVSGGTCPALTCRPVHRNQPSTTRSPQGELPCESVQPW